MISVKMLSKMAKKWQKLAASKRKRITFPRATAILGSENSSSPSSSITTVEKGHFVLYTADQRRFVVPIKYLNNIIIRELFQLAEDEFGLPSGGPITLPCDAVFMEYVISLIRSGAAKDVEKALIMSLATCRCLPTTSVHHENTNQSLISSH